MGSMVAFRRRYNGSHRHHYRRLRGESQAGDGRGAGGKPFASALISMREFAHPPLLS